MDAEAMAADVEDVNARTPRRICVVVVHGVRPHPRYATQDELADALATQLNDRDGLDGAPDCWRPCVTYPQNKSSEELSPTLTTVARPGLTCDRFDVVEAYWSPLTKRRTNVLAVIGWLYRSVFVPANTDARLETPARKMAFDLAFIGGSVVFAGILLTAAAALVGNCAWSLLELARPSDVGDATRRVAAVLMTTAGALVAAITMWQSVIAGVRGLMAGTPVKDRTPRRRWGAVLTLLAFGVGGIIAASFVPLPGGGAFGFRWQLLLATALLIVSRALLVDFLVAFFGDVLVYSSRDENDQFFNVRADVVATVRKTVSQALDDSPFGLERAYDEVIVMGHSLGSVIALDAIMALHQAYKGSSLQRASWDRLRAFVTYGSALEKARYFFEASIKVTLSSSYLTWQDAIYGPLFTKRRDVLGEAPAGYLHWSNFWYFEDPVANPIESYRSTLNVNEDLSSMVAADYEARIGLRDSGNEAEGGIGRLVCQNVRGRRRATLLRPVIHGDYVHDREFWVGIDGDKQTGMLDILERGAFPTVRLSTGTVPEPRIETVPIARARESRRPILRA